MGRITDKEFAALPAILAANDANGGDFGLVENIKFDGDRRVLGGILASLQRRGVIELHEPVTTDSGTWTQFTIEEEMVLHLKGIIERTNYHERKR